MSLRFEPGGCAMPSVGNAFGATDDVNRVPMPKRILDDVVVSDEKPTLNDSGTVPEPAMRGTLNVAPSVLMSRFDIRPSSVLLKLLTMKLWIALASALRSEPWASGTTM